MKAVLQSRERRGAYNMLIHLAASYSRMEYVCAAACLLALNDLHLIELIPDDENSKLTLCPMRKIDPDTSSVWRALQAWRT